MFHASVQQLLFEFRNGRVPSWILDNRHSTLTGRFDGVINTATVQLSYDSRDKQNNNKS